jgi:hypothetical protein
LRIKSPTGKPDIYTHDSLGTPPSTPPNPQDKGIGCNLLRISEESGTVANYNFMLSREVFTPPKLLEMKEFQFQEPPISN